MSMDQELDCLERTPLLGPGWSTVAQALSALRGQLKTASTQTVARVVLLDAALRVASHREDPVNFLADAERWARGQSLSIGAAQLCLMWCQAVARVDPSAVPPEVRDQAIQTAQSTEQLEGQWRLTAAAGSPDNIRLLREAMNFLSAPQHAHLQHQALLDLASAHLQGGDTLGAIVHLEHASTLSTHHSADSSTMRTQAMLGQLRLTQGLNERAADHLSHALALAIALDDTLSIVTQAGLLASLQLGTEDWQGAEQTATQQLGAAVRRDNWMAVADGVITLSTCALAQGHAAQAIAELVLADKNMRKRAPVGAINLVRARLAELRFQLGPEGFDPLLEAARHSD